MVFLKWIVPGAMLWCATISGQPKAIVNGRVLIEGQPAGANEKVILYNKKGNDTLKTITGGIISGTTTDVEEKNNQTINKTVWINSSGRIENITNLSWAKLFDITGREIADVTERIKNKDKIIPQNIATAIYFVQIQEEETKPYTIKFLFNNGQISAASQHNKTISATAKPLYKTLDVTVIDSIRVLESENIVGKTFPGLTTTQGTINLGNLNVQGKVTLNLLMYAVNADSGKANTFLANADVWLGTRNQSKAKYSGKTAINGQIAMRLPKGIIDTLFIKAQGYNERSLIIYNTASDFNITEYAITDKIDIDFFNWVFLGNDAKYPLKNPNSKYGAILPFYRDTPLDATWEKYVKETAEQEIARYSGGKFSGRIEPDSAQAYTKIGWRMQSGLGEFIRTMNPVNNSILDRIQVYFIRLSEPNDPLVEKAIKTVTKKEMINAVFGQYDILYTTTVPNSWKQSKWYFGLDANTYYNGPDWNEWDLSNGRVAGKLPRGYIINAVHKKDSDYK